MKGRNSIRRIQYWLIVETGQVMQAHGPFFGRSDAMSKVMQSSLENCLCTVLDTRLDRASTTIIASVVEGG